MQKIHTHTHTHTQTQALQKKNNKPQTKKNTIKSILHIYLFSFLRIIKKHNKTKKKIKTHKQKKQKQQKTNDIT